MPCCGSSRSCLGHRTKAPSAKLRNRARAKHTQLSRTQSSPCAELIQMQRQHSPSNSSSCRTHCVPCTVSTGRQVKRACDRALQARC
jgi:hypothetical protein